MSVSKSILYLILGLSFLLGSCTRYNYIPRKFNLFDHEKTNKEKQLNQIKTESEDLVDNRQVTEYSVQENDMELISQAIESEVVPNRPPHKDLGKITTTHTNQLIIPKVLKNAREYNKISFHQKQIRAKLHPNRSKTDDPQETESEFHPLAAISCLLGVVAWASIVAMEVYWMLFWSEYLILVSILAAIGAVVTGIIAMILTKKSKGDFNNRFMAVIGLVMGGIEILVLVIALFALLFFFGL